MFRELVQMDSQMDSESEVREMGTSRMSAGGRSVRKELGGRRRRSDFGSVRMSERDAELLLLIGEQYAITVDQLARLIGRSARTGRWLRDRWRQAGWIESRQLAAGGPSFVWLTRHGSRIARSPYRTWEANPGFARHIEAVAEVRLLLDRQLRLGEWHSERLLAKTYGLRSETRLHLPDAVIVRNQAPIAIEVELSLKSRARLDEIVRDLGERYEQVWYFAAARLVPTLTEIASVARWQNVQVHHHPPRMAELRLAA